MNKKEEDVKVSERAQLIHEWKVASTRKDMPKMYQIEQLLKKMKPVAAEVKP